jgi:hypothetical protein
MACHVDYALDATARPYSRLRPGVAGGRLSGTVTLTARCDDDRQGAEIVNDHALRSWFDAFVAKFVPGYQFQGLVPHLDATFEEIGFGTVLKLWRLGPDKLAYEFDISTPIDGPQRFLLKVACRCSPTDTFSNRVVDVRFTMP